MQKTKILFAASECVPFVKTGGLADVVGALPKALDKSIYDVRVILPCYKKSIAKKYLDGLRQVCNFSMRMGDLNPDVYVGIMSCEIDGITYYFVDNEYYFGDEKPYGALQWDIEKFCYFSKALLSALQPLNFHPDIIHCHDWQTGTVPVFLHEMFQDNPFYHNIRTIMTVHNLRFQGVWDIQTIRFYTGLPAHVFKPDRMEFKKDANLLKGGLVYADRITTVSGTYAEEIKMPYYGEGLDGLLRAKSHDLQGIVNGIDYEIYNPATDKLLVKNYTDKTFEKKVENKCALQEELGLPVDRDRFMIGIISRLTDQKGLDLINCVMEELLDDFTQFVVLGTGDVKYENMFRQYHDIHPDRVSANIFYSDDLSHKLYAAADAMLMPSLFEPCGLTQLISLRYGTIPIVRETGGLKDTVIPFNEIDDTGTGFSFANYNAHEMLNIVNYAKHIYYDCQDQWDDMAVRGMQADFSWAHSALRYQELYNSVR